MMRSELPNRRRGGRPERRFIDVVKEDMKLTGVREEDAEDWVRWRWMIPLKGTAERKRRRSGCELINVEKISFRHHLLSVSFVLYLFTGERISLDPSATLSIHSIHIYYSKRINYYVFARVFKDILHSSLRSEKVVTGVCALLTSVFKNL